MNQCDGCEQEAVTELRGFLVCQDCVVTFRQWNAVQESRARIEAKRRKECQDYVDSLPASERGSGDRQLLNAVLDAMSLQERLDNHDLSHARP